MGVIQNKICNLYQYEEILLSKRLHKHAFNGKICMKFDGTPKVVTQHSLQQYVFIYEGLYV